MRKYRVSLDPLVEFEREISNIRGKIEQHIISSALLQLPDYFWVIPASSSGKYHPPTSLGLSGLVRHTKSVCVVGESLLRHPMFAPFDEKTKDQIRIAMMLHDGFKQGLVESGHTVTEHPTLLRHNIDPLMGLSDDHTFSEEEIKESWNKICDLIETHMGPWNKNKEGQEVLQVPETEAQKFVHLCDYVASRRDIVVQTYEGTGSKDTSKDWRKEPATLYTENGVLKGQIPYIDALYKQCVFKGITNLSPVVYKEGGNIVLTKGEASDIINDLREKLGLS